MASITYPGVVTVLVLNVALIISSFPLSDSQQDSVPSDLLCPKKKPGDINKLYYNETSKCYKELSKGPCPSNLVITRLFPNRDVGDCDCPLDALIPFVYNSERNQCFKMYTQSYCDDGMWLVPNTQNKPECRKNPCLMEMANNTDDNDDPIVWFKKHCVRSNTSSSSLCPNPSDIIQIPVGSLRPKCLSSIETFSITSIGRLPCRPGSRRDVTGKCIPVVEIVVDDDEEP